MVTELSCWLECSVGAIPPNDQTESIVHFLYRKCHLGAHLWVPSLACLSRHNFPKAAVN